MSAASPPTPDGEHWTADYVSSNGATANVRTGRIDRLVVLGYITAVALPLIGFVVGIVIAVRSAKANRKHAASIIVVSIIASIVWVLVLSSGVLTSTSSDLSY